MAKVDKTWIGNAVINLNAVSAFLNNACLVQSAQVLRHIRLRGVDFFKQFADVFLASAQTTHDAQAHWGRHHPKNFCGTVERGIIFFEGVKLNRFGFARSHTPKYSLKGARRICFKLTKVRNAKHAI